MLDISDARTTLLAIARIVETIDKMRKKVTINDMMRIMEAFGRVVKVEIDQLKTAVLAVLCTALVIVVHLADGGHVVGHRGATDSPRTAGRR